MVNHVVFETRILFMAPKMPSACQAQSEKKSLSGTPGTWPNNFTYDGKAKEVLYPW
jgi:hypothetical protein